MPRPSPPATAESAEIRESPRRLPAGKRERFYHSRSRRPVFQGAWHHQAAPGKRCRPRSSSLFPRIRLYNTYHEQKQRFKELQTVKRNIDQICAGRNPTAERSRAMSDNLPRMDYRQHRRARRLVHECCNYDEGNCLLLDDGEPCVCVQSISLSLMCRWFRVAVLPLDGELAAALLYRGSRKRCAVCGAAFVPKSNRGKYCPDCAGRMKKIKAAERKRKQRQRCHALEPFKPA